MRLFVVHMHDYTPLDWPVIFFSKRHVVENLCFKIGKHEFLAYVASNQCEHVERIGRVIGLAKIKEPTVVSTEELISPRLKTAKCYRDGKFKWPYGTLIGEAWLFKDPPKAKPLIGSQFSQAPQGDFYILEDQAKVDLILSYERIEQDMSQAYTP